MTPQCLTDHVAALETIAAREPRDAADLARMLRDLYGAVYATDLAAFDPQAVRGHAPALITRLFDMRAALRDRIAGWHAEGLVTREVQAALRDCLRALRFASDLVGEIGIGHHRLEAGAEPMQAFTGADHNTIAHRAFDTGAPLAFRSGDVVLVRGVRHNSAAIARLGDVDSQFSHLFIVHVDDIGGHYSVEALIEDGALVSPLETALTHGVGRAMLFRMQDAELAARAARSIHDHVVRSRASGGHIPYDFSMLLTSYKRYFCSKLVRHAYDTASAGLLQLPTFPTHFADNRDFYRRIGVKARQSFAPGDMEIEPRFDLVAEWQDYRVTPRLRLQDLVMTKLFQWMEHDNWRFKDDLPILLISLLGRMSASLSEDAKALLAGIMPKIPANMRRRTIATIAMLHKTAEPLLAELEALESHSLARTGRPLHPREVMGFLDLKRSQSGGRIGYLAGPVQE